MTAEELIHMMRSDPTWMGKEIADCVEGLVAEKKYSLERIMEQDDCIEELEKWKRYWSGEIDTILAGRADAEDRIEDLEAKLAKAVEALGLADDALYEAEAILGGEYGDQYGPLCEMMVKLRTILADIKSHSKKTITEWPIEEGNIMVGEMK